MLDQRLGDLLCVLSLHEGATPRQLDELPKPGDHIAEPVGPGVIVELAGCFACRRRHTSRYRASDRDAAWRVKLAKGAVQNPRRRMGDVWLGEIADAGRDE